MYYALKIALSALVIVLVSELAKRHSNFAALIAALPLTSLLAFVWLHVEGTPNKDLATLSLQIFWLVIPSLLLFVLLPCLLKLEWPFWPSLGISIAATAGAYLAMLPVLRKLGMTF